MERNLLEQYDREEMEEYSECQRQRHGVRDGQNNSGNPMEI